MKEKFRRLLGLVLVISGIGLMGSVIYNRVETNKKQNELKSVLEDVIKEVPTNTESSETIKTDELGYTPIGLIEIPSINLSQGLVEGVTDEILQYYIGHFEDSVKPGEIGNFAVAGHRVSNYSEAFVNLYKLKSGDLVSVKSRGKEFIYEINENFIVDPDRVEVLDSTDEPTITLITCTVGAKQRVIVKGNLIEIKDI
ncbi:MAG: class D sortase [Terrisporobacter sp.]